MVSNLQRHMLAPSAASPMTSGRFFARDRHLERRLPVSGLERWPGCHPERSEGSLCPASQTLRCAQVLDVGAGRGANLFPAAETVGPHGQVIGIDLAPGMVRETTAEIKRRNLPHVSMLQMDAEHLTFPDASFDVVLCGFAIFLFPHLEQVHLKHISERHQR